MLPNLIADIRHGLRSIGRRPAYAAVVVLTLAFGVGVNTAMYSLFEQVLRRPLPVPEPDRLVNLAAPGEQGALNRTCGPAGPCDTVFSYPMFRDLEREQTPFVGIAGHRFDEMTLALDGDAISASGVLVSGSYFPVLGIQPALGRLLGPEDDRDGAAESAVLSYAYWRNRLGADPDVLGRVLLVNGVPLTIVGVAPEGFYGTTPGLQPSVYVPITLRGSTMDYRPMRGPAYERRSYWLYLFARLAPQVAMEEAEAAINPVYSAILNEIEAPLQSNLGPEELREFRAKRVVLAPGARGQSSLPGRARPTLIVLSIAAAIVLALCCANIATVVLARGSERMGEMAVRASMGGSPRRLALLLLSESALLALVASVVAWPVAHAAVAGLSAWLPGLRTATFDVRLDASAVWFAGGVAALSTVAFSLAPMLQLRRAEPAKVLQAYGARQTIGKAAARFRAVLASVQIAISMGLLVVAVLFAQSLINISRVDLGVGIERLTTFSIAPVRSGYTTDRASVLYARLDEALAAMPGVTAVTSSRVPLLGGENWGTGVQVEGFEPGPEKQSMSLANQVGSGFFETVGMPLLAGRAFTDADTAGRPKVAIVNERFVEYFGLGSDAVGARIGRGGADEPLDIEIVGVVRDAKYAGPKEIIEPQLFLPREQDAIGGRMSYYVRSALPSEQLVRSIAAAVAAVDPVLPVTNLHTMEEQVRERVAEERSLAALALGFAVLATVLAAVGLYGALSYSIAQRTRELGLRLALGAPPAGLRRAVLGQVGLLTAAGASLGLAAALLLGSAAQSLLFGVEADDPAVLVTASAVLATVVLIAGYRPARRASRIDPIVALRYE